MSQPLSIQQHLLDLVNAQLEIDLHMDQVIFEGLELTDPTVLEFSNADKRNSALRLLTKPGIEPGVDLNVTYNRLQLAKLFSLRSKVFADDGETSVLAMLPKLNARSGLELTADDLVDTTIDRSTAEPYVITLQAKASSLQIFGTLELTLGEASPPVEPLATGFFMSNRMARAYTPDFAVYEPIMDDVAPVFGLDNAVWRNQEAACGDKAGRLWAFLRRDAITMMHRSLNGGNNWTMDTFPNNLENPNGAPTWQFKGRMMTYFRGSVYGYFQHTKTGIHWICRLQEEAETGGGWALQPVLAVTDTYIPCLTSDGENYIAFVSEEPNPNQVNGEIVTYLHWSNDADQWTRFNLYHSWPSHPDLVPQPKVQVHAMAVSATRLMGVGKIEWYDEAELGKNNDQVFFELDMTQGSAAAVTITPVSPWPEAQESETFWADQYKHMAVIDDQVMVYFSQTMSGDPYPPESGNSGIETKYQIGNVFVRNVNSVGGEFTRVLENSGIQLGMIYDNGVRTVISGMRSTDAGNDNPQFLAYTEDRTLRNWNYGLEDEEVFKDIDTSNTITYVSATREGEIDPVFVPTLSPIYDTRTPLPSDKDIITTETPYGITAYAGQQSTGKIVLAGSWTRAIGEQAKYAQLVRLKAEHGVPGQPVEEYQGFDLTFNGGNVTSGSGAAREFRKLLVGDDDTLIIHTGATKIGTMDVFGYLRYPADGGQPAQWPKEQLYNQYNTTSYNTRMYKTPQGKIWVTGDEVRRVGSTPWPNLARFEIDGTLDTSFANPYASGGPLAGVEMRSAIMVPNGDIIVNQLSPQGYQPLWIKADGTVPSAGLQPFAAGNNQEISAVFADPYSGGWIVVGNNLVARNGMGLPNVSLMTAAWDRDLSWKGNLEGYLNGFDQVVFCPLKDNTGFLIGRTGNYTWTDENGTHNAQRKLFVVDPHGNYIPNRLPVDMSDVLDIIPGVGNTGNSETDTYFVSARGATTTVGFYPRYTITNQGTMARIRIPALAG